eukprot:GFUD01022231.1.p1 GENE.GFUD01022231.1~~GFUD01022231.1.p1  ORF type:complete len:519 (+),score=136.93 GFUD01022231.1:269-1825(+)
MEKTIENIKKILHIGPKKVKHEEIKELPIEKPKVQQKVLTTKVELTREDIPGAKPRDYEPIVYKGNGVELPIATEDDVDNDTGRDMCEGCRKPMLRGNEICLTNGLHWHYTCFSCDNCGADVSQQKYAYERGCLMCEPCIKSRVRTNCHKCIMVIEMEDIKLIVDGKEFHQKCFVCLVCSVQLDKIYGSKNGEYYCETCYVDKFGKKCAECAKVILGEGLRFGNESYHKDCFNCSKCSHSVEQGSVHSIKGKPVCTSCYELQFQEMCFACKLQVSEGLKFREERFHQECFKCKTCSLNLADKKGDFLLTEDGLQCKACVKITMSDEIQTESVTENCKACELPIHVKNLVFDGEQNWHYKCFCCSQCNSALVNQKYYDKSGKLFCNDCFLAEYDPTCYNCKVEIKGKSGVKMQSSTGKVLTWHKDCLQCSVCQSGISLDNVVFKDKLFCKSCYLDTILNKCDKCVKPITGVGFTFRGKFWHDTCFACDQCENIFEEGKFRNLREQKLCDDCFKVVTHTT